MQHCPVAIVVDRQDGMARKLTPRSRGRLGKSSSFNQKGQRKVGAFLAAGGFLLLASVFFLEVRLSGVSNYGEDTSGIPDDNYLNADVHREHADFHKRFLEGELARNSITAGRRTEEASVQNDEIESHQQHEEDELDDVDELEREVQAVSLDTNTRAALFRRKVDRLDLGSRRLDVDDAKLEDLEAELDMENDELEEFESFGGNFLNDLDELKDEKTEDMDDSDFGNESEESTAGTTKKAGAKEEQNFAAVQSRGAVQADAQMEQGDGSGERADFLQEEVREMGERARGDDEYTMSTSKGGKRLERLGNIKTIPRSGELRKATGELRKATSTGRKLGVARNSAVSGLTLRADSGKESQSSDSTGRQDRMHMWWDHILGVSSKPSEKSDNEASGSKLDLPKTSSKEAFSTDDEPLDEELRSKVDGMVEIEDAFLLKNQKLFKPPKNSGKRTLDSDAARKEGAGRIAIDLLNPANNPLLTDPDSLDSGGLTKNDKSILSALRRVPLDNILRLEDQLTQKVATSKLPLEKFSTQEKIALPPGFKAREIDVGLRGAIPSLIPKRRATAETADGIKQTPSSGAERAILLYHGTKSSELLSDPLQSREPELQTESSSYDKGTKLDNFKIPLSPSAVADFPSWGSSARPAKQGVVPLTWNLAKPAASHLVLKRNSFYGRQEVKAGGKWGSFPGIDPSLSFTGFMDQFLACKHCSVRVFMVWTTPPWSYTVRYQRGLESLLHFHPRACVVVFSEKLDTDLFDSFVQDRYRVAVVNPNLKELLEGTPSNVFASVWQRWRKRSMYHIHYSELVRLAALYRYGGLYLDSDVVVLKPLTDLKNSVGAIAVANGVPRLGGAVLAFDKASPFLHECLREFTATYDDKLPGWNGGEVLSRVAERYTGADVEILPTSAFYPLKSRGILRYFAAPRSSAEQRVHSDVLERILRESYTVHFWNSLTATVVPESGSLVAKVLDQHCLHCDEAL